MTDIVEQLRTLLPMIGVDRGLMVDAADEIERLRTALARPAAGGEWRVAVDQMLAWEKEGGDGWWKGFEMLKAAYYATPAATEHDPVFGQLVFELKQWRERATAAEAERDRLRALLHKVWRYITDEYDDEHAYELLAEINAAISPTDPAPAPTAAEAERDRLRKALLELAELGERGMEPDYTKWLTFHDKVAQVARTALSSAEQQVNANATSSSPPTSS